MAKKAGPAKVAMHTSNLSDERFKVLAELFPNIVTETVDGEGRAVRAVDADALSREINCKVVFDREERYQFTWPDKGKSILLANEPIAATLRPCREESVEYDSTENLYIEGDNLDVLKLLRETYLKRIKMIYIDPPYNTGKDFLYDDDFSEEAGTFLRRDGQFDQQCNRLTRNLDSNGRFHTDWLNMMYPRLRVARDLLSDEGIIFISVDDNELENLKKICNEIFGADNFVETLVWKRRATPPNDRAIGKNHEYILIYCRSRDNVRIYLQPRKEEFNKNYTNPDNDPRGAWTASDLSANGKGGRLTHSCVFDIVNPATGQKYSPPKNKCWLYNQSRISELMTEGRIGFRSKTGTPFLKRYLSEVRQGSTLATILTEHGFSQDSAKEIRGIFNNDIFEFPKPLKLLKTILTTGAGESDTVLDFFSGSATTAQAVMELNAEDGGKRKFIMIQLPQECGVESEAFKDGYKNICEIGKERIRRAGAGIKRNSGLSAQEVDTGFRVLKLDSSNMKDVYYTPERIVECGFGFDGVVDTVKSDRTEEDLLFQVMLNLGIPLSATIERSGKIFRVNENYLIACFAGIDDKDLTEIARQKPNYAVFRDCNIQDDSALVNLEQVFITYSPQTIRMVL